MKTARAKMKKKKGRKKVTWEIEKNPKNERGYLNPHMFWLPG